MCVVTGLAIIIGYLQTFPRTIIADFSRKRPTIYDNHKAPVNQEYHRKSTMSLSEYFFSDRLIQTTTLFFHRCSRSARRPHV